MNRDKQIEEMAKTCPYNVDGECMLDETHCVTYCEVAIWGAKTASDVAKEIFAEIERVLNLSKCYGDSGIYFEKDIETDIAELKKKYESEGIK